MRDLFFSRYSLIIMKNLTETHYNSKRGKLPKAYVADSLNIGRPIYNRVNMLKTILFAFEDEGCNLYKCYNTYYCLKEVI